MGPLHFQKAATRSRLPRVPCNRTCLPEAKTAGFRHCGRQQVVGADASAAPVPAFAPFPTAPLPGGIWLFYVQHQFKGVYWARRGVWDPLQAAVSGSSFYQLPAVLRWFSGSIGIHFVHHLGSRIPNYHLQRCYDSIPELHAKEPLTLRQSLASPRLKLWDEGRRELAGFSAVKARSSSGNAP